MVCTGVPNLVEYIWVQVLIHWELEFQCPRVLAGHPTD